MTTAPERLDLRTISAQPWKNGAGLTRELAFGGAEGAHFDWRFSLAEVERDAPFSAFPGIDRCIVLLHGVGMRLRSADGRIDHALTEPLTPFRFPGEAALTATVLGGLSSDFNVMTRRGVFHSDLGVHRSPARVPGADVTLLLGCAGVWHISNDQIGNEQPGAGPVVLGPLQALLWRAATGPLQIAPQAAGAALLAARLCHDRRP